MTSFSIAAVQMDLGADDNLAAMAREIALVKRRFPWVDMIVFGELCAFGPRPASAQPMPGPAEAHFCAAAKKHKVWLLPGSLYEAADGLIYNTAPVINPRVSPDADQYDRPGRRACHRALQRRDQPVLLL